MIKIALAQMDVKWAEPEVNLDTVRHMVAQATAAQADLLVLPELWGSGYDLAHAGQYATAVYDGLFREMATLAEDSNLYLVGSLLEKADGRIYNTCALFSPQGLVGTYRKLHLFRLMQEHQYLAPGEQPKLCDALPWGTTGLAICYDLRFPELFRGYAVAGAMLVVIPAQWPARRVDHWETLLRARAIENQCVVVGCNRVGKDIGDAFGGRSAVIGPWGEVLVEGDDQPALLLAEVDLAQVEQARQHIPILSDRRPECYEV
jgi:predicted amidohydrolase